MDSQNWLPDGSSHGLFTETEAADFLRKLKIHFIGFLVFPRVFTTKPNFSLKIGQVPPVMDPLVAGKILYDTEFKVKVQLTIYL